MLICQSLFYNDLRSLAIYCYNSNTSRSCDRYIVRSSYLISNCLTQDVGNSYDLTGSALHDMLVSFAEELGVKNATLMWPLRIAVAGKLVTPGGAVELCHILGREETVARVKAGIAKLS